ncbi:MAG: hypothetical protein IAE67_08030 [Candidatus Competibacteraceae bacterium]|nr:hypothetical protein [Candidatus Competibacteraceae bacterium]
MKRVIILLFTVAVFLFSCNSPSDALFRYTLGSGNTFRETNQVNFYYNATDSSANLIAVFANTDTFHLMWVTPFISTKSNYLFGDVYGLDSDIMVVKIEDTQSTSPYIGLDMFKSGSLTVTHFDEAHISGQFDFNANTVNPITLSTAILNFNGSFDGIDVQ